MKEKIYIKENVFLGIDIKTQLADNLKYTYVVDASGVRTYQSVIDEYLQNNEDFNQDMIRILKGDKALQILRDCTACGEYYPFDESESESLFNYINIMNSHGMLSLNYESIELNLKKNIKNKLSKK